MTADPTRRLLSLDLFDEGEHADLDEWGNRAVLTEPVTPVSIPEVFAAQVDRTPEAVALRCGDCSWTYRELEEAANRLAHLLADAGCGRGTVCGAAVGALSSGRHRDSGGVEDRGGVSADRPARTRRPGSSS